MTAARENLRTIAAANGWTLTEHGDLSDTFTRGTEEVAVRINVRGGIVVAGVREDPALRYLTEVPGSGKEAKVAAILSAAPAPEVTTGAFTAEGREEETKAYRIGKLLRAFVLDHAAEYPAGLVAHIETRNVCYDGTSTLRLTASWAEALINAASDMDTEAKVAARAARRTLYALFA